MIGSGNSGGSGGSGGGDASGGGGGSGELGDRTIRYANYLIVRSIGRSRDREVAIRCHEVYW